MSSFGSSATARAACQPHELFSRGEAMSIPWPWLVAQHPRPSIRRTSRSRWRSLSHSLSSRGASASSSDRSSVDPYRGGWHPRPSGRPPLASGLRPKQLTTARNSSPCSSRKMVWGAKISVLPAKHRFLRARTEFWLVTRSEKRTRLVCRASALPEDVSRSFARTGYAASAWPGGRSRAANVSAGAVP